MTDMTIRPVRAVAAAEDVRLVAQSAAPNAGRFGNASHFGVEEVARVTLPAGSPRLRQPTRPVELRGEGFEQRFDYDTLIFDSVLSADRSSVRILCPAFLNLREDIEAGTFRAEPSGTACPFRLRSLDRHDQILVDLPPDTQTLTLDCPIGRFPIPLSREQHDIFADERVIFTLSKNNSLVWIKDWARFYRDLHGATAVLVFDNDSSDYTPEELLEALREVEGLNAAVVVKWPFRHGPPGHGLKRFWDSNFSQLGAFEVARWRFLMDARSVVNCDVDELVLSKAGGSVFEAAERSVKGVVSYFGDWVIGIKDRTRTADDGGGVMRFRDYRYVLNSLREWKHLLIPTYPMRCKPKWTLVPRKCPPEAQWSVHTIRGFWAARMISQNLRFRHFREISSSWKYDRTQREAYDPVRHAEDALMADAFSRVKWER